LEKHAKIIGLSRYRPAASYVIMILKVPMMTN